MSSKSVADEQVLSIRFPRWSIHEPDGYLLSQVANSLATLAAAPIDDVERLVTKLEEVASYQYDLDPLGACRITLMEPLWFQQLLRALTHRIVVLALDRDASGYRCVPLVARLAGISTRIAGFVQEALNLVSNSPAWEIASCYSPLTGSRQLERSMQLFMASATISPFVGWPSVEVSTLALQRACEMWEDKQRSLDATTSCVSAGYVDCQKLYEIAKARLASRHGVEKGAFGFPGDVD